MRTLGGAFATDKDLKNARPFISLVFHFGGAVGDVYVDTQNRTIGGHAHKGVIRSMGEWRYLVSPQDGSFSVAALDVEIINFPVLTAANKRITDIWTGAAIEGVEVDVYQNLRQVGSTTILQELLFTGVVRPVQYTPLACRMQIVSVSEKYLDRAALSFPFAQSDLPLIDLDAIGERANVIYGSPNRVPCHAVKAAPVTILRAAMDAAQTFIPIHQEAFDAYPQAGSIVVGDERMSYTAKTTSPDVRLTGVTRGGNAGAHPISTVVVLLLTEYAYAIAGHAIKAIRAVRVRRGDITYLLDPADYTGAVSDNTVIAGKILSLIKFTAPVGLVKKAFIGKPEIETTELAEQDFTQSANASSLSSPGPATSSPSATISFGAQSKPQSSGLFEYSIPWTITTGGTGPAIYRIEISNLNLTIYETDSAGNVLTRMDSPFVFTDPLFRTLTFKITRGTTNSPGFAVSYGPSTVKYKVQGLASETPYSQKANGDSMEIANAATNASKDITFISGQEKSKSSGVFTYSLPWKITQGTQGKIDLPDLGITLYETATGPTGAVITNLGSPFVFTDASFRSGTNFTIRLTRTAGTGAPMFAVSYGPVTCTYNTVPAQGGGIGLNAANDHLLPASSAELIIGDEVLVDVDGYADDGSGTYTGTPNALIELPPDVARHLAQVASSNPLPNNRVDAAAFAAARADLPGFYKFAGVVTGRTATVKEALLSFAAQGRMKIDMPVDKLTCRALKTVYGAIGKTLTQEHIMEDGGGSTLKIERSRIEDLLNVVFIYYGRDWGQSRAASSFKKVSKAEDAASIASYGRREKPDSFLCDFIGETNAAMADDLRDFLLARRKNAVRLISGDFKLDQFELLPGDVVGLNYQSRLGSPGSSIGIVMPSGGIVMPSGGIVMPGGGTGVIAENFDGLDGTQKLLVEAVSLRPGASRDRRATRMALVLREVA